MQFKATEYRVAAVLSVIVWMGIVQAEEPPKAAEGTPGGVLPLSPEVLSKSIVHHKTVKTEIRFEGATYQANDGIPVLIGVALDEAAEVARREHALDELSSVGTGISGRDYVRQLMEAYDQVDTRELRLGILLTLWNSEDARALPLFKTVTETEHDDWVLAVAAGALAHWNERGGVRKLIELLKSGETSPAGTVVRDQVASQLVAQNRSRLWAFPTKELYASLEKIEDEKARAALFHEAWDNWFRENEQRFPVWTEETPLPEKAANGEQEGSKD